MTHTHTPNMAMYVQAAASAQEGVCPELDYAVKRLVRGLASNRKGARHGFYTALTQVGGSILLVHYFLIGYLSIHPLFFSDSVAVF